MSVKKFQLIVLFLPTKTTTMMTLNSNLSFYLIYDNIRFSIFFYLKFHSYLCFFVQNFLWEIQIILIFRAKGKNRILMKYLFKVENNVS